MKKYYLIIKKSLQRLPYIIGEHAFIAVLALVGVALLLSGGLFYQYGYSILNEVQSQESEFRLKEDVFQKVVTEQESRKQKSIQADVETARNIFVPRGQLD